MKVCVIGFTTELAGGSQKAEEVPPTGTINGYSSYKTGLMAGHIWSCFDPLRIGDFLELHDVHDGITSHKTSFENLLISVDEDCGAIAFDLCCELLVSQSLNTKTAHPSEPEFLRGCANPRRCLDKAPQEGELQTSNPF